MIRVDLNGIEAQIEDRIWTSQSLAIEDFLNSMDSSLEPGSYDPDPDLTMANKAIKLFGGSVISKDEMPFDDKKVY